MLEMSHTSIAEGDLWVAASKIRGLGELFSMAGGEPPLSNDGLKGLAYLLTELADEIDEVRSVAEAKARKGKE